MYITCSSFVKITFFPLLILVLALSMILMNLFQTSNGGSWLWSHVLREANQVIDKLANYGFILRGMTEGF